MYISCVGIVVASSYLAFVNTDGLHPEYRNKDCGKNYKFGDAHTLKAQNVHRTHFSAVEKPISSIERYVQLGNINR